MKNVFVINPVSGAGDAVKLIPRIKAAMSSLDADYAIYETEYPRHAVEIAYREASYGYPVRLFACGGDGTLLEVVNGAVGHENAEVGCIPYGSGNDYIKCFGKRDDFIDIIGQVKGSSIPVDLIKFNDLYSINVCSVGFDAEVVNNKNRLQKISKISGKMGYMLGLFGAFIRNVRNPLTVTVDECEPVSDDFLFVVAANGRHYGGSYMPTPDAVVDDGLLDVMLMRTVSRARFLMLLGKYRRGEHINVPGLCKIIHATCVKIESENEITVNMDGEVFRSRSVDFNMVKSGIKFILPSVINIKEPRFTKQAKSLI